MAEASESNRARLSTEARDGICGRAIKPCGHADPATRAGEDVACCRASVSAFFMGAKSDSATLLIIADDLTGANDAGVQFAKRGIRSIVFPQPDLSKFPEGYAVV